MTDTTDTVLPATTTGTGTTAETGIVATETTAIAGTITGIRVAGTTTTETAIEEATGGHATMIDAEAAGAATISAGADLMAAITMETIEAEDEGVIDIVVARNLLNDDRPLHQTPFPCPSESGRPLDGTSSLLGTSSSLPPKPS